MEVKILESLREYRKSKLLTQKEVACKSAISRGFYSLIERGLRVPSLENSKQIAKALDLSLDEFYEFLFPNK